MSTYVSTHNLTLIDGFWCRPDTADRIAVEDTRRLFRRPGAPSVGDVVLDLGAHIGSFSGRALAAGAVAVTAVEPDPGNVSMFRLNVVDPRANLIPAAVTPANPPAVTPANSPAVTPANSPATTTLYQGRTHGHSTVARPGRPTVEVPAISLEELLSRRDFTYVKIDVEGAEYGLDLPHALPRTVDMVFMEFHLTFGQRPLGEALRREFEREWLPVWESSWKSSYVEAVFRRNPATHLI